MNDITHDQKEFIKSWNSHIRVLGKLGFSLDNLDDKMRIYDMINELETLTVKASKSL